MKKILRFAQANSKFFFVLYIAQTVLCIVILAALLSFAFKMLTFVNPSQIMDDIQIARAAYDEKRESILDSRSYMTGESDDTTNVPESIAQAVDSYNDINTRIDSVQSAMNDWTDYIKNSQN